MILEYFPPLYFIPLFIKSGQGNKCPYMLAHANIYIVSDICLRSMIGNCKYLVDPDPGWPLSEKNPVNSSKKCQSPI